MREALKLFPGIPNFAVLDTYFHRTMSEVAKRMPISDEYVEMGVRRYGYHGISYESIIYQLQPNIPERLIVAHLGNGASISAIRKGECLDTSMGLTPSGGIISATRTGDIDPGVVIFILKQIAKTEPDTLKAADKLETVISKKSGLVGMSGISNDMRDLREAIKQGNVMRASRWTSSPRRSRNGSEAFTPNWAGWTCWSLLAGSAKTTSLHAPRFAQGSKRWASSSIRRATMFGAKRPFRPRTLASTVRVIPPAEDLMIVNHVIRLLSQ